MLYATNIHVQLYIAQLYDIPVACVHQVPQQPQIPLSVQNKTIRDVTYRQHDTYELQESYHTVYTIYLGRSKYSYMYMRINTAAQQQIQPTQYYLFNSLTHLKKEVEEDSCTSIERECSDGRHCGDPSKEEGSCL